MAQNLQINFTMGAFPIGFRGNCQDFANALTERLTGTLQLGTSVFTAQYGGPQPSTDVGPWWKNGTDLYIYDYSTGQYQPMEDQTPIGACMFWAGSGAPPRWLLCQGQAIGRSQYSRLFQRIGTQWGAGDGAITFNLPPCGKYLLAAGYDGISGNTYTNGAVGGVGSFLLQPEQLPELYVLTHGGTTQAGAGGTAINMLGGSDQPIGYNWPVYSSDGLPVTQRNGRIPVNPQYQAMNLVIRYI